MSSLTQLARLLAGLKSQASLSNTGPQLQASSVLGGSLDFSTLVDTGEVDDDGEPIFDTLVQASVGLQEDGSTTVVVLDGPEPAAPAGLVVTPGVLSLTAAWAGLFVGGATATLDHDHIAVHVGVKSEVDGGLIFPSDATLVGTIRSTLGGEITAARAAVAHYVALVAVTQSGKWSTISDVLTVTPFSMASAGGGTAVYHDAVEPTGGTYATGDTWFDSGNGNRINLYDAAVPGWVPLQFGTNAVADFAIQSGKIGSLDAGAITGGTITSDLTLAGSIKTGTVGARVEQDVLGIRVFDVAEVLQTSFNTDGTSTFKGQIEASGMEVDGKLKINSADSEIASSGKLIIAGGVTAPSTAPQVTAYWSSIQLKDSTGAKMASTSSRTILGFTRDPANGEWISAAYFTSGDKVIAYRHNADGTYKSTIGTRTLPSSGTYAYSASVVGIALLGSEVWFAMLRLKYDSTSFAYDVDGQIMAVTAGTVKTVTSLADTMTFDPIISLGSATSTQVVVRYRAGSGSPTAVALYDPATSIKSSTWTTAPGSVSTVPAVAYGSFDFGANRYVLGGDNSANFRSYTTAGVEQTSEAFASQNALATGLGYYGGVIWSTDGNGRATFHDGPKTQPRFGYVWRDSDSGGTGIHETALSPLSAATARRARIRVTTAALPVVGGTDGVNSVRIYGGALAGPWYRQAEGTGTVYNITTLLTVDPQPGQAAPFPTDSPGILQSANGLFSVDGNGVAKIPSASVTALSSLFVAGTPSGSPQAILEASGFVQLDGGWQMAAGTSPVTPAIAYNTQVTIFTLPVGFRPAQLRDFSATPFGSAALLTGAVRVTAAGAVIVYVNNGGSGSTTGAFPLTGVRFKAA